MADPTSATTIPHLMGITTDGTALTQIVATNFTTGEEQIKPTDSGKIVIFDAAEFTSGYTDGDVIAFENVGATKGNGTITINTAGGFQEASITSTAALTVSVDI